VVRFLTDEWVDALDRAVPDELDADRSLDGLVIGYVVDDFAYHLAFGDGRVRVQRGEAGDATVTFRCDRETAEAIARGESSAQRAFMAGQLRIGGDASALLRSHAAIASLPDIYAAVRPQTDF
jgi:putative sterol carrier protein